jgi:hypothetical protein
MARPVSPTTRNAFTTWGSNRVDFRGDDLTVQHGRGYLRLIHRPTGLTVEAFTGTVALVKTFDRLTEELKQKVIAQHQVNPRNRPERPAGSRRVEPTLRLLCRMTSSGQLCHLWSQHPNWHGCPSWSSGQGGGTLGLG